MIDADAKAKLEGWVAENEGAGRVRFRWDRDNVPPNTGTYVAPASSNSIAPAS